MGTVKLTNIRVYAYHGCLEEESIIGSDYSVDISVHANLEKAAYSDDLHDTADYVLIHHIVKQEMSVASKLLEHVARRIGARILKEITLVSGGEVMVSKLNPPIGGDVASVSVTWSFNR